MLEVDPPLLKKQKFHNSLLILLLLLVTASFLRTLNLNKEFSGDETILAERMKLDFNQMVTTIKQKDVYPPLTYILVYHWMKINRSIVWIRFYFVFFGVGVCLLIYLLGKEYLNIRFARIALILAIFSPLLIYASQYARSYADSAFWMLLSSLYMLKIVKGKDKLANWVGYIISAALSLYTFYFSSLLIFAQLIYVTIFKSKKKKFILKWYFAVFLIGLIFAPWLPSALEQFNNASSIVYDWSSKGLNMGPLRFGLYARNIFALVGFDPYFMYFRHDISKIFSRPILIICVFLCFSGFIYFLYIYLRYLKIKSQQDKALIWFFFFITFIPLLVSWALAGFLNILPHARYFVAFHAFFLISISILIYNLWEKTPLKGIICIAFILTIFTFRIPGAISSDFGTKKAISYIERKLSENDCLICIHCPSGKTARIIATNIINIKNYFKFNKEKSEYVVLFPDQWRRLKQKISTCKTVWFYRVYGNVEVFGANRILDDWLKNEGYKIESIKKFKNIDIIAYEK